MATEKFSQLTAAVTIDGSADYLPITVGNSTNKRINRNTLLGLTSAPLGLTDSQSPTNKIFDNTNQVTLKGTKLTLQDDTDTTKQARFLMSSITSATTRSYTLPDRTDTVVLLGATQTLTAKTLTSPTVNTPTITSPTITGTPSISGTVSGSATYSTPTLTTPTISATGWTNANHAHAAANSGGTLSNATLSVPYKFRASRNAAANSGNNVFAVLAFDTEQFDTGNNLAAGVFTVPVSGFYQFNWQANGTTSGAETFVASLFKNGTQTSDGTQITATTVSIGSHGSDMIQCTVNDTVDVRVYQTVARALNVGNTYGNYFSGYLVSQT